MIAGINSLFYQDEKFIGGTKMKDIDLSRFRLVEPIKMVTLAFSIMADGTVRMNSKFRSQFKNAYVCIFIDDSGKQILLQEVTGEQEGARAVPQNGTIRATELLPILKNHKIAIPARYSVERNEGVQRWLGEIDANYVFQTPKINGKNLKSPRKKGLEDMMMGVK